VLGVAAMAAPKYLPRLASSLAPVFKSTVRGTFKLAQKSKEAFAEAHEHVTIDQKTITGEGLPVNKQPVEVQKQALGAIFVKKLIADENSGLAAEPAAKVVLAGVTIFEPVPVQHRAELSAIVAELLAVGALPLIDAEPLAIGVVADMACLDDDEIFTVMGMWPVPVERDIAADKTVVERKGSEMLGGQNDRVALSLVGAKRARRHHSFAAEPERKAVIVQPRYELAVSHREAVKLQILDETLHQARPWSRCDENNNRIRQFDRSTRY
jgi:hypothetical protein